MNIFIIITTIILILLTIMGIEIKYKRKIKKGDFIKLKNNHYSDAKIKYIKKINKNLSTISIQYETMQELSDPIYENVETQLIEKI